MHAAEFSCVAHVVAALSLLQTTPAACSSHVAAFALVLPHFDTKLQSALCHDWHAGEPRPTGAELSLLPEQATTAIGSKAAHRHHPCGLEGGLFSWRLSRQSRSGRLRRLGRRGRALRRAARRTRSLRRVPWAVAGARRRAAPGGTDDRRRTWCLRRGAFPRPRVGTLRRREGNCQIAAGPDVAARARGCRRRSRCRRNRLRRRCSSARRCSSYRRPDPTHCSCRSRCRRNPPCRRSPPRMRTEPLGRESRRGHRALGAVRDGEGDCRVAKTGTPFRSVEYAGCTPHKSTRLPHEPVLSSSDGIMSGAEARLDQ